MVPRGWNRGVIGGPAHPTISPDAGVPQELTPPHDKGLRKDFRCAGLLSRAKLGRHRPGKRLGLSSLSLRDGSSGSQNCKLPKKRPQPSCCSLPPALPSPGQYTSHLIPAQVSSQQGQPASEGPGLLHAPRCYRLAIDHLAAAWQTGSFLCLLGSLCTLSWALMPDILLGTGVGAAVSPCHRAPAKGLCSPRFG